MHWHAIPALLSGRGCLEVHSCLRWTLKISCGRRWERGIATPEFAPRAECRAPRVHPAAKRAVTGTILLHNASLLHESDLFAGVCFRRTKTGFPLYKLLGR